MPVPRTYKVADVARMSGVSIRTLHDYDAIGLLTSTGRTEANYRLCTDANLLRLQRVKGYTPADWKRSSRNRRRSTRTRRR